MYCLDIGCVGIRFRSILDVHLSWPLCGAYIIDGMHMNVVMLVLQWWYLYATAPPRRWKIQTCVKRADVQKYCQILKRDTYIYMSVPFWITQNTTIYNPFSATNRLRGNSSGYNCKRFNNRIPIHQAMEFLRLENSLTSDFICSHCLFAKTNTTINQLIH
jgi:hypothetical protein